MTGKAHRPAPGRLAGHVTAGTGIRELLGRENLSLDVRILSSSSRLSLMTRKYNPEAKYWHIAEAVKKIGRPCVKSEIKRWLAENYPHEIHTDLQENLSYLTVNDPNRRHYSKGRRNFRSDSGDHRDQLYRKRDSRKDPWIYEKYDPWQHGIIDLKEDDSGKWICYQVNASLHDLAEAKAQFIENEAPITSELDGRQRMLRLIVQRQGQPGFRKALLEAYEQQCAITGCTVLEILEAAHIRPYMGIHTNCVDNGLLLRSDLHTLFDLGLIWINSDNTVQIDPVLRTLNMHPYRANRCVCLRMQASNPIKSTWLLMPKRHSDDLVSGNRAGTRDE